MSLWRKLFSSGTVAFDDPRSRKLVFIPHCALNQNARVAGAAERPAAVTELVEGLLKRDIGIVQMPCPELLLLGLDCARVAIRKELQEPGLRFELRKLARVLLEQVKIYESCGVKVLGILGKNGSPTCGVEETWNQGVVPGRGVFVEELMEELRGHRLDLQVCGFRDSGPQAALEIVDRWSLGGGTLRPPQDLPRNPT